MFPRLLGCTVTATRINVMALLGAGSLRDGRQTFWDMRDEAMATGYGFALLMTSVASMRHILRSIMPHDSPAVTFISQEATETSLEHQEAVLRPTNQHRAYKHFGLMGLVVVVLGASIPYGLHLWQYYQTHEGLDHGVGHSRPRSITRQRHWLAYHFIATRFDNFCHCNPLNSNHL
jgi:hypothetical protein